MGTTGSPPHVAGVIECGPEQGAQGTADCAASIVEFSTSGVPTSLTLGSDHLVWFDDRGSGQLVALDSFGSVIHRVNTGTELPLLSVATGRDDAVIWFTSPAANRVSKLTLGLSVSNYDVPVPPSSIAVHSDSTVWLTSDQAIVRFEASRPNSVTQWPALPTSVVVQGSAQSAWYAEGSALVRLTQDGQRTAFPGTGGSITGICAGADGSVWFVDQAQHRVGRVRADGTLASDELLPSDSAPFRIVEGPDQALWFTEPSADRIGRLSREGKLLYHRRPADSVPFDITSGPDSSLWFTESGAGKVARLILNPTRQP